MAPRMENRFNMLIEVSIGGLKNLKQLASGGKIAAVSFDQMVKALKQTGTGLDTARERISSYVKGLKNIDKEFQAVADQGERVRKVIESKKVAIKEAQVAVRLMRKEVKALATAERGGVDITKQAERAQQKLKTAQLELSRTTQVHTGRVKKVKEELGRTSRAFKTHLTEVTRGDKALASYDGRSRRLRKGEKLLSRTIEESRKTWRGLGEVMRRETREAARVSKGQRELQKELRKTQKATSAVDREFEHWTQQRLAKSMHGITLFRKSLGAIRNQLLVLAFATRGLKRIFDAAFTSSRQLEAALKGLGSVAINTGAGMAQAQQAALDLASKGLIQVGEAAGGLKNLLSAGFGLPEAIKLMNTLTDAASFNRQGTLALGEAVVGATQGIKNQNCCASNSLIFNALTRSYETVEEVVERGEPFYTVSYDEKSGELEYGLVSDFFFNGFEQLYKVTLESEREIELTEDHLVFTRRGWIKVQDLISGQDEVLAVDNHTEVVEFYGEDLELDYRGEDGKYFVNCLECGEEVYVQKAKLGRKKFCSQECLNEYRKKNKVIRGKVNQFCLYCGEGFHVKPSKLERKKFCSWQCRNAWYEENKSEGPEPNTVCIVCEKPYYSKPHKLEESKFCSRECKGKWNSQNAIGVNGYNYKYGRSELVDYDCDLCGETFQIEQYKLVREIGEQHFCSSECLSNFRQGLALNNGRVRKAWNHIEGRCKNLGISTADYLKWKRECLRRDSHSCRLCGSRDLLCTHHGVPVKERPDLALDVNNGITLCGKCHRKVHKESRVFKQKFEKIISITPTEMGPVYDVTVEKLHNFMANQMIIHNCLAYDTLIYDPVGGVTKTIEEWHDEEIVPCVLSVNRQTGEMEVIQAEYLHYNGENEVFEIELENGTTIEATANHRFLTQDGFKFLEDLDIENDVLYYVDEELVEEELSDLRESIKDSIVNNDTIVVNKKMVDKDNLPDYICKELNNQEELTCPKSSVLTVVGLLNPEERRGRSLEGPNIAPQNVEGEPGRKHVLKKLGLSAGSAESLLMQLENTSRKDLETFALKNAELLTTQNVSVERIILALLEELKSNVQSVGQSRNILPLKQQDASTVLKPVEIIGNPGECLEAVIPIGKEGNLERGGRSLRSLGPAENSKNGDCQFTKGIPFDVYDAESLLKVILSHIIFIERGVSPIDTSTSITVSPFVKGVTEKYITLLNQVIKRDLNTIPMPVGIKKITSTRFVSVYDLSVPETFNLVSNSIVQHQSIMVDNAGITKNLSIMYREYAARIGTSMGKLTELQKRQAIYNGIMKEGAIFAGDAVKVLSTLEGTLAVLRTKVFMAAAAIGDILKPALEEVFSVVAEGAKSIEDYFIKLKESNEAMRESKSIGEGLANVLKDLTSIILAFVKPIVWLAGVTGGLGSWVGWTLKLLIVLKLKQKWLKMVVKSTEAGAAATVKFGLASSITTRKISITSMALDKEVASLKGVTLAYRAASVALKENIVLEEKAILTTAGLTKAKLRLTLILKKGLVPLRAARIGITAFGGGLRVAALAAKTLMRSLLPLFAAILAFEAVIWIIDKVFGGAKRAEEMAKANAEMNKQLAVTVKKLIEVKRAAAGTLVEAGAIGLGMGPGAAGLRGDIIQLRKAYGEMSRIRNEYLRLKKEKDRADKKEELERAEEHFGELVDRTREHQVTLNQALSEFYAAREAIVKAYDSALEARYKKAKLGELFATQKAYEEALRVEREFRGQSLNLIRAQDWETLSLLDKASETIQQRLESRNLAVMGLQKSFLDNLATTSLQAEQRAARGAGSIFEQIDREQSAIFDRMRLRGKSLYEELDRALELTKKMLGAELEQARAAYLAAAERDYGGRLLVAMRAMEGPLFNLIQAQEKYNVTMKNFGDVLEKPSELFEKWLENLSEAERLTKAQIYGTALYAQKMWDLNQALVERGIVFGWEEMIRENEARREAIKLQKDQIKGSWLEIIGLGGVADARRDYLRTEQSLTRAHEKQQRVLDERIKSLDDQAKGLEKALNFERMWSTLSTETEATRWKAIEIIRLKIQALKDEKDQTEETYNTELSLAQRIRDFMTGEEFLKEAADKIQWGVDLANSLRDIQYQIESDKQRHLDRLVQLEKDEKISTEDAYRLRLEMEKMMRAKEKLMMEKHLLELTNTIMMEIALYAARGLASKFGLVGIAMGAAVLAGAGVAQLAVGQRIRDIDRQIAKMERGFESKIAQAEEAASTAIAAEKEGVRKLGGTIRAQNLQVTISPTIVVNGETIFIGAGSVHEFASELQTLLMGSMQQAIDTGEVDLSTVANMAG